MSIDGPALTGILAMAAVSYALRISGYWLAGRLQPSARIEAALQHMPGSVIMALIAPAALQDGPAGLVAVGVSTLVARLTGSLLPAAAAGVITLWALRTLA